jgi:hypothetical protein
LALLLDPIGAALAQNRLARLGQSSSRPPSTTEVLARIQANLLPHQQAFCQDTTHRKLGLVCGFGAGKTYGLVAKAVTLAAQNIGYASALFEPVAPMLRDILERTMDDLLTEWQIPFTFRVSPLPEYVLTFAEGEHTILLRTMETWNRIRGQNLCAIGFDEADTAPMRVAENATRMALARLRAGNIRQFYAATTPEGYGWAFQTFQRDAKDDTRLIQAKTEDNPHLPDDFIPSLVANYPANLIQSYLNGEFVNLTTGTVYDRFNRAHHVRPLPPLIDPTTKIEKEYDHSRPHPDESILVGIDFNVGNTNAVLAVRRGRELFVFDEVAGAHDTDALGKEIRRRFPDSRILGYPDASGRNRSTNSSRSDIAILQSYDISNMAPSANPPVRDRVASVQAALENGNGETRLWVSPGCKKLIECLELQCWTDKGEPDKDNGFDHMNDALGYMVHRLFEVGRATAGKAVRGIRVY